MKSFICEAPDSEKTYYMSKEVAIVKIYESFHLAKIKFIITNLEIIVDFNALSATPDMTKSLSLGLIGGNL
jgi:hypothetical protein